MAHPSRRLDAENPASPVLGSGARTTHPSASIEDRRSEGIPTSPRRPGQLTRERNTRVGNQPFTEAPATIDNGRFGTRTVRFETGRLARQAGGSAVAYLDDETMVLSTTTASKAPKEQFDFFPLTVDVEERVYAAGKIPGGVFRREGRPSQDAILTCRLIDRPLRPSFVKGLRNEVQVVSTVLSLQPRRVLRRRSRSTRPACPPSSPACRSPARSVAPASP